MDHWLEVNVDSPIKQRSREVGTYDAVQQRQVSIKRELHVDE